MESVLCLAFVRLKMQVNVKTSAFYFCHTYIISKVLVFMMSVQEKKSVLGSLPVHSSKVWVVGELATEQTSTRRLHIMLISVANINHKTRLVNLSQIFKETLVDYHLVCGQLSI